MTLIKDNEKRQSLKMKKKNKSKISPINEEILIGVDDDDDHDDDDGDDDEKELTKRNIYRKDGETDCSSEKGKLKRKPSFRRKLSDLPAIINSKLDPIRRTFSFNKDLNRILEKKDYKINKNYHWSNSLSSLAEDDDFKLDDLYAVNEDNCHHNGGGGGDNDEIIAPYKPSRNSLIRSHSFFDSSSNIVLRRRKLSENPVKRPASEHYYIDFNNSTLQTYSLPTLQHLLADKDDHSIQTYKRENNSRAWERSSTRNFLLRFPPATSEHSVSTSTVRSRSLSQLDMLEGRNLSVGETSHPTYQSQPPQLFSPNNCNPRLLVPTSKSIEISNSSKLTRSQVNSSEYFSVGFEVGDDTFEKEEFLPATKGSTLLEVLTVACDRRNIDLARVDVFLDPLPTPLSVHATEASCLGGKHLRITARSSSQKSNQNVSLRKMGGSYRSRSGRFFSVSTEDSSMDSEMGSNAMLTTGKSSTASLKASKQRWSGFFTNTKGTKMELLVEQLNNYTKHGVPRLSEIQLPYDLIANEKDLYSLEEDWRDIVENCECLTEKQQQQQTALWELATTEVAYIKTLKVVTDLFMACLCSLQASNILNEVDRIKLFSNIPDIYAANRYFWGEHILRMINNTRSTRQPLDPGHLLNGFESFQQIFSPYTRYCSEQSKCQQYCRDRFNDNELFTAYLAWCETQKDCNRLKLLDILVKPMQRLTKYSLLLKAVHKNTEDDNQKAELILMIKYVDNFVVSVNAALRRSEETARLTNVSTRLDSYDVVETRDEELEKLVKLYSTLDITTVPIPGCPKDTFRTLLREGDLKLRDAATSKTDIRAFLMTDMLLLCKSSTKKGSVGGSTVGSLKIIRQPFIVDRIRINELKESSSLGLIYLNEYGVATAAFILTASEPKIAKSWMESVRKAQQQFAIMKIPPLGELPIATVSRQASTYLGDGDFDIDDSELLPRTPRGSSRASRVSSLAHSHSGSMEMEGVYPGNNFIPSNYSRNVSIETNEPPRASSVSSEEGGESGFSYNHRPLQIRRSLLSKSPTPNTLIVPAYSLLGQSLPNLTLATSPHSSSPTPPNSLLIVPQITKSKDTLLSPGHRGISYPPPSPPRGALRRAFAVPQSRNPPLIKTRHIASSTVQSAMSFDTEAIEERRRRLDAAQRNITKDVKRRSEDNR